MTFRSCGECADGIPLELLEGADAFANAVEKRAKNSARTKE